MFRAIDWRRSDEGVQIASTGSETATIAIGIEKIKAKSH